MKKMGSQANSLKHGGYSTVIVLPDEDSEAFEALRESLIEEWRPQGTLEENTVLNLAKLMQQIKRVDEYFYKEMILLQRTKEDEIDHANEILPWLEKAVDIDQAKSIIALLPNTFKTEMDRGIIISEFQDPKKEISRLANRLRQLVNMQEEIKAGRYDSENVAKMRELIAEKIALDERLVSNIDKTIKRLALIKTFKQADAQNFATKSLDHQPVARLTDQSES
jgi:hypothetical protein